MPDALFTDPRLAALYDVFDDDRADLDHYVAIVEEVGARSALDVGAGTGCLALRLSDLGVEVTALDPAAASLDVGRGKPGAERVRWIHGYVEDLPPLQVDIALMTGNVAQAINTEGAWQRTLAGIHDALRVGGRLIFESRVPARRAWLEWTEQQTREQRVVAGVGQVETWSELLTAEGPLVTFRHTYVFTDTGDRVVSDSTLAFRTRDELVSSVVEAGLTVDDVRDAPDRPGLEYVVLARRRPTSTSGTPD